MSLWYVYSRQGKCSSPAPLEEQGKFSILGEGDKENQPTSTLFCHINA